MNQLKIGPGDESLTQRLGCALAGSLPTSAVIALSGPLGAGKTRLVQAVGSAVGAARGMVASPTFTLIHEYPTQPPIFHFDTYRLLDEDEFLALGPEEYFSRQGWSFVEWADRVTDCLPAQRLEIEIEQTAPKLRTFSIRGYGSEAATIISKLAAALKSK
jgi:tRNA threonylcarbamoyladenosine biosynthesis protein TsaE